MHSRSASIANYHLAEHDKLQAQAACADAIKKMRRAQAIASRFASREESLQELKRQVNAERALRLSCEDKARLTREECERLKQGIQVQIASVESKEKEKLTVLDQARRIQRKCDRLHEQIKEIQAHNLNEKVIALDEKVNVIHSSIQQAKNGQSVVGLSEMLGVSPGSMKKVEQGTKMGSLCSAITEDASTPEQRNRFLERVATTLTPVIEELCKIPKFKGGKHDSRGVVSMILGKIARKRSAKSKSRRRLIYDNRPRGVSNELHSLLKEFAQS